MKLKNRGSTIKFTAPQGGVTSGQPYLIGNLFGVVHDAADEGEDAVLFIEQSVVPLPKATGAGESFDVGDPVYFDEAGGVVDTDDENLCVAVATSAAGVSDTTVHAKILPIAVYAAAVVEPAD